MKLLTQKILILCIVSGLFNLACFWDYDTIEMERAEFPNILELISGKFLRHSQPFYYWRVKDREKQLKQFPDSLSLYDDLAVAYSKLGNDKKAIDIILKKDSITPNLYKTFANLGTFYLHDGQIEKGIINIQKAIKINTNAHFGREIYQLYLAQYIKSKMVNKKIHLPLATYFYKSPDYMGFSAGNFYSFIAQKYFSKSKNKNNKSFQTFPKKELIKAITGISGMMKFGNHSSPILLEVLGDLLLGHGNTDGARQLAARAYLKAAYQTKNEKIKKVYHKKVEFILFHQVTKKGHKRIPLNLLDKLLKEEILLGNNYIQRIHDDELKWIKAGENPEINFSNKYYIEPSIKKRVQEGVPEPEFLRSDLISDTTVGKNIPFVKFSEIEKTSQLDSSLKQEIDSAYSKYLKKQKPALKIKEVPSSNIYILITISAIILLISIILVYSKNKNRS